MACVTRGKTVITVLMTVTANEDVNPATVIAAAMAYWNSLKKMVDATVIPES